MFQADTRHQRRRRARSASDTRAVCLARRPTASPTFDLSLRQARKENVEKHQSESSGPHLAHLEAAGGAQKQTWVRGSGLGALVSSLLLITGQSSAVQEGAGISEEPLGAGPDPRGACWPLGARVRVAQQKKKRAEGAPGPGPLAAGSFLPPRRSYPCGGERLQPAAPLPANSK